MSGVWTSGPRSWDGTVLMLMKWLKYAQAYRAIPKDVFGDDAAVKVRIDKKKAEETLSFMKTLYRKEDTKGLAVTLEQSGSDCRSGGRSIGWCESPKSNTSP
uniref:Uncharacterized protein n=1 Tax=Peronospora matthiolae TaxID=2874970 RepID=A0AAV1TCJ8_9STRA